MFNATLDKILEIKEWEIVNDTPETVVSRLDKSRVYLELHEVREGVGHSISMAIIITVFDDTDGSPIFLSYLLDYDHRYDQFADIIQQKLKTPKSKPLPKTHMDEELLTKWINA